MLAFALFVKLPNHPANLTKRTVTVAPFIRKIQMKGAHIVKVLTITTNSSREGLDI